MAELQTSTLIKILIGVFVIVLVGAGLFLFFRDTVIDFFKNLIGGEEESPGEGVGEEDGGGFGGAGASRSFGEEKTYEIDRVGFKIGNNTFFGKKGDNDVSKTGEVEFIVDSEDNCERIEYQVWEDRPLVQVNLEFITRVPDWDEPSFIEVGDLKMSERINLQEVNTLLNVLPKGKYHIDAHCFDDKGKDNELILISANLEIK